MQVDEADLVGCLAPQQLIGQLRQHVNHPLMIIIKVAMLMLVEDIN